MRRILHIDMDAFFAAIEEKRHPELRGRPIIVGGSGDPHKRGVVSTANYEARKFGIRSGMPLITALRLCPQAVFLPVDYREYSRISAKFKSVLRQISPVMEDIGIDEAYLDISENPESSEEIARKIKQLVYESTGLTCSIGIGPNKLIAKIASDARKPDGLTIVTEDKIAEFLDPLPVRKLYGVGPKTEAALKGFGINTIGDLRARSRDELIKLFGNSYGSYLYEASRGIDESPLVTEWEPKSMSREITLQKDTTKWQKVARVLAALAKEVVEDLKESGYRGKTVTVKLRFSDFSTFTRAKTLSEPTDRVEPIRRAAFDALGRLIVPPKAGSGDFTLSDSVRAHDGHRPPAAVRLVGLRVSGLEPL